VTPWWRDGVLYQVYPRSFADSNGDGIGDLPGIVERLDHLEWLGVDGVWLNPTFPSPNVDFGYDVADYTGVHPDLGTLDDLDRLVAEAGKRGIRVLLDLVPNHTSKRHPWFQAEHRDWYVWTDRPTNWRSVFGGSAWDWDEREARYYLHSFHREMPDLDWWVPEVREEFDRILRFWFDRGIAGFRIDVAHRTVRSPSLRDAVGRGRRARIPPVDLPETHAVMRRWRALADSYDPQRLLLGETYVLDVQEMATFYGAAADELHLAFNFPFVFAGLGAAALRRVVEKTEEALPGAAWPVWTLSNHDVVRFPSRWCDGDERKMRCALLVLLTLRGTPVLYYGDEIGMSQVPVPEPLDPAPSRRDGCRTPMQWSGEEGGGFTRAGVRPWLPFGDLSRNVEAQKGDRGSTLHLCRDLIGLRLRGAYETLPTGPGAWAWRRGDSHIVAVNLSERAAHVRVEGVVAIGTDRTRDGERVAGRLRLAPWEGVVITAQ
jgi:alpha-glucosidase